MKCFMCKGSQVNKPTTFMVDIDACIIIVKNVPSQVCNQCGEASYNHEVTKHLESIINSMRASITEIAIVNYTKQAA